MADLVCPVCGQGIDPSRFGVAMWPDNERPDEPWHAAWVPFIEDLRGSPRRLVHAKCYVDEQGLDALLAAVHHNDERMRGVGMS